MSSTDSDLLSGRVEVDETFIGGVKPGVRGRGALGKTLVAGAVEILDKGWGRARLRVIADASTPSLRSFLTDTIMPGSLVVTDGWSGYPGTMDGYTHERVSLRATGQRADEVFPGVHRLFAQVKRMIDGTYQGSVSPEHLQAYLDEYVFRFNRRHSRYKSLRFFRLVQRAVGVPATPYKDLSLIKRPKSQGKHPGGVTGPRRQSGTMDTPIHHYPWRESDPYHVT